MELNDIKIEVNSKELRYSRSEIEDILRIRTKRSLSQINRKMMIDAISMIGSVWVLVTVTFLIGLKDRYIISLEIVGLASLLLIHYRIKYKLLNRLNFEIDICSAAKKAAKRLSSFMLIYLWVIPTGISTLYLYIQLSLSILAEWSLEETIFRYGLVVPLILIGIFLTRGLIKLLYQTHLDELNEVVHNLH